jgi:hypothetical protein
MPDVRRGVERQPRRVSNARRLDLPARLPAGLSVRCDGRCFLTDLAPRVPMSGTDGLTLGTSRHRSTIGGDRFS